MPVRQTLLSVVDHARDAAGLRYVYPVVSRRAGGVSVGINLNPNNACNWRCIYCQVEGLSRGGPPPTDLGRLETELSDMLDRIVRGRFLDEHVPPGQRRLADIAFSGNGEPTSAREFPEAVGIAVRALAVRGLSDSVRLRLITNGSLVDRAYVSEGIRAIGETKGEVWFKVDGGTTASVARVNGVRLRMDSVARRLRQCAALCETWAQTCVFSLDGMPPSEQDVEALVAFLQGVRGEIAGVHLYSLARPPAQAEASRLRAVSASWLQTLAARMRAAGLTVRVSP